MAAPACPRCFDEAPAALECLDVVDAADKLGVSADTVYHWCQAGLVLAKRIASGTGKWQVLVDSKRPAVPLPVDPPRCLHVDVERKPSRRKRCRKSRRPPAADSRLRPHVAG